MRLGWFQAPAVAALMAGGYVAVHAIIAPWPCIAPVEALDWLPYCALGSLAVGLVAQALSKYAFARSLVVCVFVVVGVWLFYRLTPEETRPKLNIILVQAAVAAAFWLGLDRVFSRLSPRVFWATAPICAAGVAAALLLSGSMSQGQAAFAFAGVTLVIAAIEIVRPSGPPNHAAVVVFAFMLLAQILGGVVFSDLRLAVAGLLLAAPLLAAVAAFGPLARAKFWKRLLAALVLVGLAVATAVGLAIWLSPPIEF